MRTTIVLTSFSFLAACGSSTSGPTCGDGTTLENGSCVATGSGSNVVCGTGTHLDNTGTECLPDGQGNAAAPTITAMTPSSAGVTGFVLFEIQGTGFSAPNVTDLHVYFGDTTPSTTSQPNPCEAEIGTATEKTITGEVPPACALDVTAVTVTTNVGMATTGFTYLGVYAADGDGGGNLLNGASGGNLYLIDPFAALWFDLGPMLDATGTNLYGMQGIAFDSAAKLWGVTTGDSPGDGTTGAQLVTMSFGSTGVTVTPVGLLVDSAKKAYSVTDIKFKGATLYGWGVTFPAAGGANGQLVTINTTTGVVTPLGTAKAVPIPGALVVDGTGTIFVASQGAAADTNMGTTGEYDSVDGTSGALTSAATLDNAIGTTPVGAPINAMTYFDQVILAVVDNGTYGAFTGLGTSGTQLAIIDTTNTPIVNPLFELPAQAGFQSQVDAIDVPPAGVAIARSLRGVKWNALKPASIGTQPVTATHAPRATKYSR